MSLKIYTQFVSQRRLAFGTPRIKLDTSPAVEGIVEYLMQSPTIFGYRKVAEMAAPHSCANRR
jgi:hypothetical protein